MTPGSEEGLLDVWVVEDDRFLRDTVRDCVDEAEGMACGLAVESCEEVLTALGNGLRPSVILLDLRLPEMSGLDGIAEIRRIVPQCEIVVMTIRDDDDAILRALCAGASGYLIKPLTEERIVDAVRTAEAGGSPMSPSIARRVLDLFSRYVEPSTGYGLTDREREVLRLLTEERTQKQIAGALHLSVHTVDNHVRSVYKKLHVQSRTGAVVKALKEGLL